jgi:hypothetical protein
MMLGDRCAALLLDGAGPQTGDSRRIRRRAVLPG